MSEEEAQAAAAAAPEGEEAAAPAEAAPAEVPKVNKIILKKNKSFKTSHIYPQISHFHNNFQGI